MSRIETSSETFQLLCRKNAGMSNSSSSGGKSSAGVEDTGCGCGCILDDCDTVTGLVNALRTWGWASVL